MGKYIDAFDSRLKLTDDHYRREQYQSFLTASEWRNVEIAEELTQLLRENKSMFQFPYFRQVWDVWKIAYLSYSAARKYNSISEIIFSEYILMDVMIATFSTMELIPKGIISLLLYPFLDTKNSSPMQQHLLEYFEKYTAKIQTVPFYDHPYAESRAELAEKYQQCEHKTWVDWFSWTVLSSELWAREWLSKPLKYWFHQEGAETDATTDVLVKFDAINVENPEQAKQLFQEQFAGVSINHSVTLDNIHLYAKNQYKTKEGQTYTSVYARLNAPRYGDFQPVVQALATQGIHLRKISGNDQVQVKCTINTQSDEELLTKEERLNKTPNVTPLYSYGDRMHDHRRICLFDVPVKDLDKTLSLLEEQDDVAVSFIHNF